MAKFRVPLFGSALKSVTVDSEATKGATLGRDLYRADGSVVTEADLAGTAQSGGTKVAVTLWKLIQQIPANIAALAGLSTNGWIRRDGAAITARALTAADSSYDNSTSGLGATDVQGAVDQIAALTTRGWARIAQWQQSVDGNVSQLVASVTGYSECLVVFNAVTLSASSWRYVQVSINGGVSYLTASGDYREIDTDGVSANNSNLVSHSTASASARSGRVLISCLNIANAVKPVTTPTRSIPAAIVDNAGSTNPITHVKAHAGTGINFTGGAISIYAR